MRASTRVTAVAVALLLCAGVPWSGGPRHSCNALSPSGAGNSSLSSGPGMDDVIMTNATNDANVTLPENATGLANATTNATEEETARSGREACAYSVCYGRRKLLDALTVIPGVTIIHPRRGTSDDGRTTIEGLVKRRADLKASLVLAGRRGDAAFLTTPPSHYEKA